MTNITQKIRLPFKSIRTGLARLFFGAAKSAQTGLKKGICLTGKTAGRLIWDKKLENFYMETQNNIYIKTGVALAWLGLLSWFACKICMSFPTNADTVDSLPFFCYLFAAAGVFLYFLSDMRRLALWNKRENIKDQMLTYTPEQLKQILLTQNLPTCRLDQLIERFKNLSKNKDILNTYEDVVLYEMDEQAAKVVERYSKAAGIGSAVSPKWSWDYLLAMIAFSKMLSNIAKIYRVKLSLRTFISLFVFGLGIIAVSTIITQGIKQITEKNQSFIAIFGGAGAWIASKIIELALPCCTMGAVGYAIQYVIRPIKPYV